MKNTNHTLVAALLAAAAFLGACSWQPPSSDRAAGDRELAARSRAEAEAGRVRAQISAVEHERASLSSRFESLTAASDSQQLRYTKYQQAIEDQQIATKAYMMNHKMAVAAIVMGLGGAAVAIDQNNTYSQDARQVAGVVGAVAVLWAIANHEEMLEVGDTLVRADSRLKDLKAAAQHAYSDWQNAAAELQGVRTTLGEVDTRLGALRASL